MMFAATTPDMFFTIAMSIRLGMGFMEIIYHINYFMMRLFLTLCASYIIAMRLLPYIYSTYLYKQIVSLFEKEKGVEYSEPETESEFDDDSMCGYESDFDDYESESDYDCDYDSDYNCDYEYSEGLGLTLNVGNIFCVARNHEERQEFTPMFVVTNIIENHSKYDISFYKVIYEPKRSCERSSEYWWTRDNIYLDANKMAICEKTKHYVIYKFDYIHSVL